MVTKILMTVSVPPEVKRLAEERARLESRSLSNLVTVLLEQGLKKEKPLES